MASAAVPFVGPSYNLTTRKADCQRTVNMYLKAVESGAGRAKYILESVPGLLFFNGPFTGAIRAMAAVIGGRAFILAGNRLFEIFDNGSSSPPYPLLTTTTGTASLSIGRSHVVAVDGSATYVVWDFTAITQTALTDPSYTGSHWVAYVAGRYVFGKRGTDQFIWTDIDDPTTIDPLDFATAESSTDGLVWGIEHREELWLFGTSSVEVWRPSSSADAAFEKNQGVSMSVGCVSGKTVCSIDNGVAWVGQDENGGAVVYLAQGYSPTRISTHVVEEALQASTDIEEASAYSYQQNGHAFICFNAPGVSTTWCYDITTGQWHERAEFVDGEFEPNRATCHAFAFGWHLFGTEAGNFYVLDAERFLNNNDVLCRERTSPHYASKQGNRVFFPRFRLICTTGTEPPLGGADDPVVQLAYSNNGGKTWSDFQPRSLGQVGEDVMPQWNRCGSGNDRVWKVRCTDNIHFDIIDVDIQAEEGLA
jgi:hypothetical protein